MQTVRVIEGHTVLCLRGRDILDLITLARVFSAYVDDNCPHKFLTRITSFGFTQPCEQRLHEILHDMLYPTLSFDLAVAALLYDRENRFRFRYSAADRDFRLPRLQVG